MIGLIWAQSNNGILGANGTLPWHVPEDLKHFQESTMGHPVIMGKNTWNSIGGALPGRTNIVVSSSLDNIGFSTDQSTNVNSASANDVTVVNSIPNAIAVAQRQEGSDMIWFIGGGTMYKEAIKDAGLLRVTYIDLDVEGDTPAPKIDDTVWEIASQDPAYGHWKQSKTETRYRFVDYTRK